MHGYQSFSTLPTPICGTDRVAQELSPICVLGEARAAELVLCCLSMRACMPLPASMYASTYLQAMCCPPQDNNSLQGSAGKPWEIQHFLVGSGFLLDRDELRVSLLDSSDLQARPK